MSLPPSHSFPSSAWERTFSKLRFARRNAASPTQRLTNSQIQAGVCNRGRRFVRNVSIGLSLVAALAVTSNIQADEGITIRIEAGKFTRQLTPVRLAFPKSLEGHTHFELSRIDASRAIPVQIEAAQKETGRPAYAVWLLAQDLEAGESRTYELIPIKKPKRFKRVVSVINNKKSLSVSVGKKTVLKYNHATVESPDASQPYFRRSGYIHPLFNPAGQTLTDDFAPDHAHQHGLMMAWTDNTFEGRPMNFWDQAKLQGMIEHVRFEQVTSGNVFGGFTAVIRHVDQSAPGGPKTVLNERWSVRVYAIDDYFLFDLESVQTCAGTSPLVINKYHYGGLAIRGNRQWLDTKKSNFLTSDGKTRLDGNHTRPAWVDLHGSIDGRPGGVTIFCHPDNFCFPQPVRLHPTKPYFCFAPMVLGEFNIEPGKAYVSRYRFFAHNGPLDVKQAERLRRDYTDPPKAQVVSAQ